MNDIGNKDIFAKNLKNLMQERKVNAKELSRALDFPYTTVLSWLKAEYYPRIDKIEDIARYFGVMKSDLMEEQTEKPTAADDGLSENKRVLMDLVKDVPDDKAGMVLRVLQSMLEAD